jgi:hypothetical protein
MPRATIADLMISHSESGRTRRHAAAYDRPAKETLAPKPVGFIDAPRDVLARAEHEQEIGGFEARADQMPGVDLRDLCFIGQSGAPVHRIPLRGCCRIDVATMPGAGPIAKSHFVAIDCGLISAGPHGSNASGR